MPAAQGLLVPLSFALCSVCSQTHGAPSCSLSGRSLRNPVRLKAARATELAKRDWDVVPSGCCRIPPWSSLPFPFLTSHTLTGIPASLPQIPIPLPYYVSSQGNAFRPAGEGGQAARQMLGSQAFPKKFWKLGAPQGL